MALKYPRSMEDWAAWQASRQRLRRTKHRVVRAVDSLRGTEPEIPRVTLYRRVSAGGDLLVEDGRTKPLLIAMDSASPTSIAAVADVIPYCRGDVAVLAPRGMEVGLPGAEAWSRRDLPADVGAVLTSVAPFAVMSLGAHMRSGALADGIARTLDVPHYVVQHGALTPYSPPLPEGARLLAWTQADADFWTAGRDDVETAVVGSQLLWRAGHETTAVPVDRTPVFLGQLRGAELPRWVTGGAAQQFCLRHDAMYRPHPSETDVLSRLQHQVWQRRGIQFAPTDVPLREVEEPLVAVFSTGILEAAARGVPAWAYAPRAPRWVHEFWERYGMKPYGGDPTPALRIGTGEPAVAIAGLVDPLPGEEPGPSSGPTQSTGPGRAE